MPVAHCASLVDLPVSCQVVMDSGTSSISQQAGSSLLREYSFQQNVKSCTCTYKHGQYEGMFC